MLAGLSKEEAGKMTMRYGSNVSAVYRLIADGHKEAALYGLSLEVYGSLLYGLKHEVVITPADFFIRRTGSLLFDVDWATKWKTQVISYMQDYHNWNEVQLEQQKERLAMEMEQYKSCFSMP